LVSSRCQSASRRSCSASGGELAALRLGSDRDCRALANQILEPCVLGPPGIELSLLALLRFARFSFLGLRQSLSLAIGCLDCDSALAPLVPRNLRRMALTRLVPRLR
jgi:hypothetical protein